MRVDALEVGAVDNRGDLVSCVTQPLTGVDQRTFVGDTESEVMGLASAQPCGLQLRRVDLEVRDGSEASRVRRPVPVGAVWIVEVCGSFHQLQAEHSAVEVMGPQYVGPDSRYVVQAAGQPHVVCYSFDRLRVRVS